MFWRCTVYSGKHRYLKVGRQPSVPFLRYHLTSIWDGVCHWPRTPPSSLCYMARELPETCLSVPTTLAFLLLQAGSPACQPFLFFNIYLVFIMHLCACMYTQVQCLQRSEECIRSRSTRLTGWAALCRCWSVWGCWSSERDAEPSLQPQCPVFMWVLEFKLHSLHCKAKSTLPTELALQPWNACSPPPPPSRTT